METFIYDFRILGLLLIFNINGTLVLSRAIKVGR